MHAVELRRFTTLYLTSSMSVDSGSTEHIVPENSLLCVTLFQLTQVLSDQIVVHKIIQCCPNFFQWTFSYDAYMTILSPVEWYGICGTDLAKYYSLYIIYWDWNVSLCIFIISDCFNPGMLRLPYTTCITSLHGTHLEYN